MSDEPSHQGGEADDLAAIRQMIEDVRELVEAKAAAHRMGFALLAPILTASGGESMAASSKVWLSVHSDLVAKSDRSEGFKKAAIEELVKMSRALDVKPSAPLEE